jgi:hypothetical protein
MLTAKMTSTEINKLHSSANMFPWTWKAFQITPDLKKNKDDCV